MSIDVKNNTVQEIIQFNTKYNELNGGGDAITAEINKISDSIIKDTKLQSEENKKLAISLISNKNVRESLCNKIGITTVLLEEQRTREMGFEEKIIKNEKNLNESEKIKIMLGVHEIFDKELNEGAQNALLDIFIKIPDKELVEFIENVQKLSKGLNPFTRLAFVRTLDEVRKSPWQAEIFKLADLMISENMTIKERKESISILKYDIEKLPIENKNELNRFINLVRPKIGLVHLLYIADYVKLVEAAERFFPDGMNPNQLLLFDNLRDFPQEKLPAMSKHIQKLFNEESSQNISIIIKILAKANPEGIDKLMEYVSSKNDFEQAQLLKALASFPRNEIQWDNENLTEWLITPVMTNPDKYSEEIARSVAEFTFRYPHILPLGDEDPLYDQAMAIMDLTESQNVYENPYKLREKLKELAKQPTQYQPPTREIENVKVDINMKSLKEMSVSSKIAREDLPKNATLDAFNQEWDSFKAKILNNEDAKNYLESTLGTSLTDLEAPLIHPDHQLENYLKISEGVVTEKEAKWKKVVSFILSRKNELTEAQIDKKIPLTDREQALVGALRTIQNCDVGIDGGISDVYNLLKPKYKYTVKLSAPKTYEEMAKETARNEALKCIEQVISGKGSYEDEVQALIDFKEEDLQKLAPDKYSIPEMFLPILDDDKFWSHPVEDNVINDDIYLLNKEGAEKLLETVPGEKNREMITQILYQLVQEPFVRNEEVMKELLGSKDIGSQGVHQLRYLWNNIAPIVGAGKGVIFDLHIQAINPKLFKLDRDKMLEVYFKHVNAEVIVNEVVKKVNENFDKNKEMLIHLLRNKAPFLDIKNGIPVGISKKGAIELIKQAGYFTEV